MLACAFRSVIGDEQFGVTNDVDEQDMPDLKFDVWKKARRGHETAYL